MKSQSVVIFLALAVASQSRGGALLTQEDAKKLMQKSGCMSCHAIDKTVIGPAYKDVAKRYKKPDKATLDYLKGQKVVDYLQAKVRMGTKPGINKNWIKSPEGKPYGMMTPNPVNRIPDDQLVSLINYILSLE